MEADKRTVLLIEDQKADQILFERAMRAGGFENPLETVTSAEQAIEYLRGEGQYADRAKFPMPQLIVLDLTLPGKSGLELCRWIRAREQTARYPLPCSVARAAPPKSKVCAIAAPMPTTSNPKRWTNFRR